MPQPALQWSRPIGAGRYRASGPSRWLRVSSLIAAILVTVGLVAGWHFVRGDANPDWGGYERVYRERGAWLAEFDRDPLFTWAVAAASETLGPDGYELFRLGVFGLMLASALWLAFRLPFQRSISFASLRGLTIGATLLAVFFTKSTVQIREGLAFIFIAAAVVRVVRPADDDSTRSILPSYVLLGGAAALHLGTGIYLAALAAIHLMAVVFKLRAIRRRSLGVLLLGSSMVAAVLAGWYLVATVSVRDAMGLDLDYRAETTWLKYAFWSVYGTVVLHLARALRLSAADMPTKTANAFTVFHASFVMPFLYLLVLFTIATSQPAPVISLSVRMLSTGLGVALIVLLLRGKATVATLAISCFLLLDQIRTILAVV